MATMEQILTAEPRRNEASRDIAAQCPVGQRMHCMKLLGQHLMARDFGHHVADLQIHIAVLNGFTALGIAVTDAVG